MGGGLHVEGVGLLGDPAGPPDRDVEGLDAAPGVREPVDQVEGVGEQGLGGVGGDTEGEAEGFGCERGDQRGALAAERLVGVQVAVAAPDRDAGVGGGGVQDAPLVGELELAEVGFAADPFVVADGGEQRVGSEVVDPGPAGGWCCSWVYSSTRHRQSTGSQNPLSTRGLKKFSTYRNHKRSTGNTPCAERRRRVPAEPKRRVTTSLENQRPGPPATRTMRWVVVSTRLLRNLLDQRGLRLCINHRGRRGDLVHKGIENLGVPEPQGSTGNNRAPDGDDECQLNRSGASPRHPKIKT